MNSHSKAVVALLSASLLIPFAAPGGNAWAATGLGKIDPRPRIVHDPDLVPVVATYNTADFGADPSGTTDSTAAVQSALAAAGESGGGVVWLGTGRYLITSTVTVPKGVTLLGSWVDPDRQPNASTNTVLLAMPTAGPTPALVDVVGGGGLQGVTIYYPGQNAATPTVYGPTVRLGGNGSQFASLKQVTLVNPYEAVRAGPDNNELGVLDQVRATPLAKGVTIDFATDVGRLEDVRLSPRYWAAYDGTSDQTIGAYSRQHLVGLDIGRSDTQYVKGLTVEDALIGMRLRTDRGVTNDVTMASSGQYSDIDFKRVVTGVQLDDFNTIAVQLTHAKIGALRTGIAAGPKFANTTFSCHDCTIDAPEGSAVTIAREARGTVSLFDSRIGRTKKPAIVLHGGSLQAQHTHFKGDRRQVQIAADAGVGAINLVGTGLRRSQVSAEDPGTDVVVTESDRPQIGHAPAPPRVPEQPRPLGDQLTVATSAPYQADATGSADSTAAIQEALDTTARLGGGITYLPAGKYRIDGSLVVPTGVELRGAQIGPFHTNAAATVLYVYGGQGRADGPATISLRARAGVTGLLTWYPEQSVDAVTAYPYAIRALGRDAWVRILDIGNAYQGVDLSSGDTTGHYVDWVVGAPLKNGMSVGGSKGGIIRRAHFNPHFWFRTIGTGLPGAPADWNEMIADFFKIMKIQDTTLETFRFGAATGEVVDQTFAYRSKMGVHFLDQGGDGFEGLLYGLWVDAAVDSFVIDKTGTGGFDCVNCDSGAIPWGFDATSPTIPDPPSGSLSESYIRMEPSAGPSSRARFYNYSANAFNWNPFQGVVVRSGSLTLAQAAFTASVRDDAGTLRQSAGKLDALGLTFNRVGRIDGTGLGFLEQPVWTDVDISEGVSHANITGVVARTGFRTNVRSDAQGVRVLAVAVRD